jgi:hypothetical protein
MSSIWQESVNLIPHRNEMTGSGLMRFGSLAGKTVKRHDFNCGTKLNMKFLSFGFSQTRAIQKWWVI